MPSCIVDHLEEVRTLCERYGIRRLDLFGSAMTDRFDELSSDLDFVVDFADRSLGYSDRYLAVADALETLFGRPIDLVTERSIQDPSFRQSVEASRKAIYDRGDSASAA